MALPKSPSIDELESSKAKFRFPFDEQHDGFHSLDRNKEMVCEGESEIGKQIFRRRSGQQKDSPMPHE